MYFYVNNDNNKDDNNKDKNNKNNNDKERGGVAHLIVHVIVEGVELVGTVEGDTSEAGMLCDGDR